MNTQRMVELADKIEQLPHYAEVPAAWRPRGEGPARMTERLSSFNMARYYCGTVGCIAGWACNLWPEETGRWELKEDARAILGLPDDQAHDLFHGAHKIGFTSQDAAALLRLMADRPLLSVGEACRHLFGDGALPARRSRL